VSEIQVYPFMGGSLGTYLPPTYFVPKCPDYCSAVNYNRKREGMNCKIPVKRVLQQ